MQSSESGDRFVAVGALPLPAVLIVDDRPANLLALEGILRDMPIEIVRADSGKQALRQMLKREFALVLLDVQMPDMDGFETAAAIKARPRTADVPIIFVTAISRDADHVFRGYEHGAVDYLMKPFEPAILRAKVRTFVDLHVRGETIKAQAKIIRERELALVEARSEQRYRRLAESLPLALFVAHPDGRVYFANQTWRDYGGGDPTMVTLDQAIEPADAPTAAAAWRRATAMVAPFELEARLRRASDGSARWHLVRGVPERDEHGKLQAWIVTATEIHAQKLAELAQEQLVVHEQAAREAAEAASRAKDEFLANASHELRTPLNAILGWAQMLGAGLLGEDEKARALRTIEQSAKFQAALIEDILDVARVKSGKLTIRAEPVDLVAAATAAIEQLRPAATKKSLTLTTRLGAPQMELVGDPDRLQQIVQNLVGNAIKFTPAGGTVACSLELDGDHAEVRVTDDGAGMTPELLTRIFDRFVQADTRATRRHQGLGLGLSISRSLVELHGGTIEAKSDGPGRGSTFIVRLPLRGRPAARPRVASINEGTATKRTKNLEALRVLVVDGDGEARAKLASLFEGHGARTVAVPSKEAALGALEGEPFHVMIADLGDGEGYGLVRELRARSGIEAGIPAIALTAGSRSEDGGRAVDAGFQLLLPKPVEPAELVDLVASLGQARRELAGV
jgi:PAS domain S-box-containing protein